MQDARGTRDTVTRAMRATVETTLGLKQEEARTAGSTAVGSSSTSIRVSELLSALSYALDLTEGRPMGHSVRSCIIGMRIAQEIGLPEQAQADLYYTLLLKDAGCSSNSSRLYHILNADDIQRQGRPENYRLDEDWMGELALCGDACSDGLVVYRANLEIAASGEDAAARFVRAGEDSLRARIEHCAEIEIFRERGGWNTQLG